MFAKMFSVVVLTGAAWVAGDAASQRFECCFPGSDCCNPPRECCIRAAQVNADDCCARGSACCDPAQECCAE